LYQTLRAAGFGKIRNFDLRASLLMGSHWLAARRPIGLD
jgi:hypothetical protein